jgi:ssDNA-binding Zn-finger/Zn-ribbon topoisomerase 1
MKCPKCGAEMRERKRRSDGHPFMGCSKYPACDGTRETDRPDDPDDLDIEFMSIVNYDVGDR